MPFVLCFICLFWYFFNSLNQIGILHYKLILVFVFIPIESQTLTPYCIALLFYIIFYM